MGLPERQREIVVEKLATLESTPIEVVETLGDVLSSKVGERVSRALNQTGGEKSAAAVLNAMSKDDRKKLLDNIDERQPDLVRSIRMKMFTFDDLQTLDVKTMQKIMREVDAGQLAIALKAATTTLRDAMLGALSKRAAENVNDEIEGLPDNLSMRAIESAQNGIIDVRQWKPKEKSHSKAIKPHGQSHRQSRNDAPLRDIRLTIGPAEALYVTPKTLLLYQTTAVDEVVAPVPKPLGEEELLEREQAGYSVVVRKRWRNTSADQ